MYCFFNNKSQLTGFTQNHTLCQSQAYVLIYQYQVGVSVAHFVLKHSPMHQISTPLMRIFKGESSWCDIQYIINYSLMGSVSVKSLRTSKYLVKFTILSPVHRTEQTWKYANVCMWHFHPHRSNLEMNKLKWA